jgi:hypothetical protein
MHNIQSLQKRLLKIEKQLEEVRGCSPLTHGWQTQKYAQASRKWDILAQEKMRILQQLDDICQCSIDSGNGEEYLIDGVWNCRVCRKPISGKHD